MLASKHTAKKSHQLSAEQLRKQALKVEAMENARVAEAKKELKLEEEKRAAIDKRVAKMLVKAQAKDTKKEIEAAAEQQFEKAKQQAIKAAAKAIEQATIAKEVAVKVAEQKLGASDSQQAKSQPQAQAGKANKSSKQQLGANNDKFLNMNPPTTKDKDPFADLDPPIIKSKKSKKSKKATTRQQMAQAAESEKEAEEKVGYALEKYLTRTPFHGSGSVFHKMPRTPCCVVVCVLRRVCVLACGVRACQNTPSKILVPRAELQPL
jgi:hypothetical protein